MNKLKIQVLGSGCTKCKTLYELVKKVAEQSYPDAHVEYITDVAKIVELVVMSSPVFAVNGKVVIAGKIPSETEILDALKNA